MEVFHAKRGSCSYDNESIDETKVPSRYKHLVKEWAPKDLIEINIVFSVDERIYCVTPSSLRGFGLFSMDGIQVFHGGLIELMEYVRPCYN